MEHVKLDILRSRADIRPAAAPLTRRQKLERWADAIERSGLERLRTLHEVEYATAKVRAAARRDGSAIAVALADPELRGAGLGGDSFGDAVAFFELTEPEAHRLLCSCLHGGSIGTAMMTSELRRMAGAPEQRLGFFARIARRFGG